MLFRSALLNNEIIKIFRSPRLIHAISLDKLLFIFKWLNILDATHYLKKLILLVDRATLLDKLMELESSDNSFYESLINELNRDSEGIRLIDSLNERALIKNDNISLLEIEEYYNRYYLNRHHNDNGSLINAIMGYLNKKADIELAIDIYKRLYSRLDISYKDTLGAIRRLNDYILSFYEEIYSSPDKYIAILDELNDNLSKGRIEANSFYVMLRLYVELTNKNYRVFDNIILYKTLLSYDIELKAFYKHYYSLLLDSYFSYIATKEMDMSLITSFNLIVGPFLAIDGAIDRLISYLGNNEGNIFHFLLIGANSNIKQYKRIIDKCFKRLAKVDCKRYLDDYISYLMSGAINEELRDGALSYIGSYIENNMSKFTKILLKLKHK